METTVTLDSYNFQQHILDSLRSTKESAILTLCWVSCVIQAEKNQVFLCFDTDKIEAQPTTHPALYRDLHSFYISARV